MEDSHDEDYTSSMKAMKARLGEIDGSYAEDIPKEAGDETPQDKAGAESQMEGTLADSIDNSNVSGDNDVAEATSVDDSAILTSPSVQFKEDAQKGQEEGEAPSVKETKTKVAYGPESESESEPKPKLKLALEQAPSSPVADDGGANEADTNADADAGSPPKKVGWRNALNRMGFQTGSEKLLSDAREGLFDPRLIVANAMELIEGVRKGHVTNDITTVLRCAAMMVEWCFVRGYELTPIQMIMLAETHKDIWMNMGHSADRYNLVRAKKLYEEALRTVEGIEDSRVWVEYTRVLQNLGEFAEASEFIMKLLSNFEDHDDFPAFLLYAGALLKSGKDFDRAGSYFFEAMNMGPPRLFKRADVMFIVARNLEESTLDLEEPVQDGYRMVHGNLIAEGALPDDADFDEWLADCRTWQVVADKCAVHGCFDLAADLYGQGLAKDPWSYTRPKLWFNYSKALVKCGKMAEAQLAVKQAQTNDPFNQLFQSAFDAWGKVGVSSFKDRVKKSLPKSSLISILEELPGQPDEHVRHAIRMQAMARGFFARLQLKRVIARAHRPGARNAGAVSPKKFGQSLTVARPTSPGGSVRVRDLEDSFTSITSIDRHVIRRLECKKAVIFMGHPTLVRVQTNYAGTVRAVELMDVQSGADSTLTLNLPFSPILETGDPRQMNLEMSVVRHPATKMTKRHRHYQRKMQLGLTFRDMELGYFTRKNFEFLLRSHVAANGMMEPDMDDHAPLKPVSVGDDRYLHVTLGETGVVYTDIYRYVVHKGCFSFGGFYYIYRVENVGLETRVLLFQQESDQQIKFIFKREHIDRNSSMTAIIRSLTNVLKQHKLLGYLLRKERVVRTATPRYRRHRGRSATPKAGGRPGTSASVDSEGGGSPDRTSTANAHNRPGSATSMDGFFGLFDGASSFNGQDGAIPSPLQFSALVNPDKHFHKCGIKVNSPHNGVQYCLVSVGIDNEGAVVKITSASGRPVLAGAFEHLTSDESSLATMETSPITGKPVRSDDFCRQPTQGYMARLKKERDELNALEAERRRKEEEERVKKQRRLKEEAAARRRARKSKKFKREGKEQEKDKNSGSEWETDSEDEDGATPVSSPAKSPAKIEVPSPVLKTPEKVTPEPEPEPMPEPKPEREPVLTREGNEATVEVDALEAKVEPTPDPVPTEDTRGSDATAEDVESPSKDESKGESGGDESPMKAKEEEGEDGKKKKKKKKIKEEKPKASGAAMAGFLGGGKKGGDDKGDKKKGSKGLKLNNAAKKGSVKRTKKKKDAESSGDEEAAKAGGDVAAAADTATTDGGVSQSPTKTDAKIEDKVDEKVEEKVEEKPKPVPANEPEKETANTDEQQKEEEEDEEEEEGAAPDAEQDAAREETSEMVSPQKETRLEPPALVERAPEEPAPEEIAAMEAILRAEQVKVEANAIVSKQLQAEAAEKAERFAMLEHARYMAHNYLQELAARALHLWDSDAAVTFLAEYRTRAVKLLGFKTDDELAIAGEPPRQNRRKSQRRASNFGNLRDTSARRATLVEKLAHLNEAAPMGSPATASVQQSPFGISDVIEEQSIGSNDDVSVLSNDSMPGGAPRHVDEARGPGRVMLNMGSAIDDMASQPLIHRYFRGNSDSENFFPQEALMDPQALVAALRFGALNDGSIPELPHSPGSLLEEGSSMSSLGNGSTSFFGAAPRTAINAAARDALFRGAPMFESSAISPTSVGVLGRPSRGKLPRLRRKKKQNPIDDDNLTSYTNRRGTSVASMASQARSQGSYYSVSRSSVMTQPKDPMMFLAGKTGPADDDKGRSGKRAHHGKSHPHSQSAPVLGDVAQASIGLYHKRGYTTGENGVRTEWESKLRAFARSAVCKSTQKFDRAVLNLQRVCPFPISNNEVVVALADSNGVQSEALGKLGSEEYRAEVKLVTTILNVESLVVNVPKPSDFSKSLTASREAVLSRTRASATTIAGKIGMDATEIKANDLPHRGLQQESMLVMRRGAVVQVKPQKKGQPNLDFALEDPSGGMGLPFELMKPLDGASPPGVGGLSSLYSFREDEPGIVSLNSLGQQNTNNNDSNGGALRMVSFSGPGGGAMGSYERTHSAGDAMSDQAEGNQSNFSMTPMSDMTVNTDRQFEGRPFTGEQLPTDMPSANQRAKALRASSTRGSQMDVQVNKMTSSLRLSSAIETLFAEKPRMVVLSKRDAYRAYEDALIQKSPLKKELARGQTVLKKKPIKKTKPY